MQETKKKEDTGIPGYVYPLAINAAIGFCLLAYSFARNKRFRKIDPDRDAQFPAFRRLDA